jgi:tRNA(fMet)-specific endonuclease VapC
MSRPFVIAPASAICYLLFAFCYSWKGETDELCLPVIVLGEYGYGIANSRYRAKYQHWLARDLDLFRILEVTVATTLHYAEIRVSLKAQGTSIPANGCWIASLAKEYRLPIVSRDPHFDSVKGIRRIH